MFKIMVVDDEVIFREYIKMIINWEAYEFDFCAEATNGDEALEICNSLKPDIALIDINMPTMDGLSLSEKLKERFNDIGIILITGHNDFEYARRAIKIGVEDYIVKPFDEDELLETLLKMKEKLEKVKIEKSNKADYSSIKKELVLNVLLESGINEKENLEQFHRERFNIDLVGSFFLVSTIEIDNMFQKWHDVNSIINSKYTVISVMKNIVKRMNKHVVFNGPENRIVSILGFDNEEELSHFRMDIYNDASNYIRAHYDFTVTIGVGTPVEGFQLIRNSYIESLDAIRYKVITSARNVILYSNIKADVMNCGFYPNDINLKLIEYLRLNDFKNIKKELINVFLYINNGKLSIDCRYAVIIGLKSVCLSFIIEMGKNMEEVLGIGYSPMEIISRDQPIEDIYKALVDVFERTVFHFSNRNSKTKKTAEMIKSYIDDHYKDIDLNLEKIGKNLYVSPDYLRKVFKQELNVTLTAYITGMRMQKAKALINKGNVTYSELCAKVGYNDASYFSKCFKKYYGLSPRDYENSIK